MNRREAMTGLAAGMVAAIPAVAEGAQMSPADSRRIQYAVCKERGHRATVYGNGGSNMTTITTQFVYIPDGPPRSYPNVGEGQWAECWDCKTRYRFVTTLEESNTP